MTHKVLKQSIINKNSLRKIWKKKNVQRIFKSPIQKYIYTINELTIDINSNKKGSKYNACFEPNLSYLNIKRIINEVFKEKKEVTICDLGMGLGTKMFLFCSVFEKMDINVICDGVELNEEYVNMFNENLKPIWVENNIEVNMYKKSLYKHKIDNYDLVYLYRPLSEDVKMEELYSKLSKNLKVDSILFDPGRKKIELEDLKLIEVDGFYLWKKLS